MNDKLIFRLVTAVSIFVFIVVVILQSKIIPTPAIIPAFTPFLPKLNAILNGTCSLLLILSLYFITNGKVTAHKRVNILAFILSSLFLVSYILFHWLAPETKYGDLNGDNILTADELSAVGVMRTIYLVILISHILLAAIVLPLILLSFYYGLQMKIERHRKLVRWSYPIWLYVTMTGVLVYILISPYYRF